MARITISVDHVVAPVDRRILGGFAEHLGRCVYGGIYDEGSPLADERGFRKDVIEAVRRLRPPVLRWPGGNFVSGYHWTDGIGPKENRPRRMELAWRTEESNRFGTDEFLAFCEAVGAEPYLCVNMGTGTMDEAMAWVEYCNGTGDTEWANRRRENGHEEPYRVRYWGLGNEMYGPWQIGQKTAEDYVKEARQWAKVLTWTDPSIELVSCGENGWSEWDDIVISGLAEFVRWHIREHIPERVGLPGFLRGRRYVAYQGHPKYFNFYETETPQTLESPAYRAAQCPYAADPGGDQGIPGHVAHDLRGRRLDRDG